MRWFRNVLSQFILRSVTENMPDLLPLTGAAIADYQNHLDEFPNTDPVILDYLTRHINGLMCAEIEQVVTSLVCARLGAGYGDEETLNFFPNFLNYRHISRIRNARVDQIRITLSSFGSDCQERFDRLVRDAVDADDIGKLSTVIRKRNDDAHSIPPTITFQEVEESYLIATAVMEAVRLTLET